MDYQAPAPAAGAGGRGCYNCGDASHRAADCPTKGTPTCYNCGEKGHVSRECTSPQAEKTCYRCGGTGHISRECTKDGGAAMGGRGAGNQECYKCGQVGHIARNCSQGGGYGNGGFGGRGGYGGGAGYGGARQTTCYSCGGFGHMSRDCTQGQKCFSRRRGWPSLPRLPSRDFFGARLLPLQAAWPRPERLPQLGASRMPSMF